MHIVQLMASPFVGGPERQVLGLARALTGHRTTFLSFAEGGRARALLDRAREGGFAAIELASNYPRIGQAVQEVAGQLRDLKADVVCTSGYKPDLIGWRAARWAKVPVVAIAHGWTGATWKVRLNEWLDAVAMRFMDAVVCVSEAMARRVRRSGVSARRCVVIRNALDATPYDRSPEEGRQELEEVFRSRGYRVPELIVGAVGRLSPEKGFDVLIEAAAEVVRRDERDVGFVVFGEGPRRVELERLVEKRDLSGRFILPGFRGDLDRVLPGLDLAASPSHTEGLPVAVLEVMAAGVATVATAVGGTPEVVMDGETGVLIPPAKPFAMAEALTTLLHDRVKRCKMGKLAAARVRSEFTFASQAAQYEELFRRLVSTGERAVVCEGSSYARR